MKKLGFVSALLIALLSFTNSITAQTTYTVDNQTNCDIEIQVDCYNANCVHIGVLFYDVADNFTAPVDDCVGSVFTVFTVNWANLSCQVPGGAATVSAAGNCLGVNPTGKVILNTTNCPNCATAGFATATVSGTTLTVTP